MALQIVMPYPTHNKQGSFPIHILYRLTKAQPPARASLLLTTPIG